MGLHLSVVLAALMTVWRVQSDDGPTDLPITEVLVESAAWPAEATAASPHPTPSDSPLLIPSLSFNDHMTASPMPGMIAADHPGGAGLFGGLASQGSAGETAAFFGTQDQARRLVYLVDASGSLLGSVQLVLLELKRSIGALREPQVFTVLFLTASRVHELPPGGLRPASAEHRQQAMRWIDQAVGRSVQVGFSASPMAGIEAALGYQPDAVWLLSDNLTGSGRYEIGQAGLLERIAAICPVDTRIHTVQFLKPDPLVAAGLEATMQLIAQQTGGHYRFVTRSELGIQ